ncbi:MAG TPA: DNA adenine methylase [Chloroflexi bacterium]|nr:DNA adenine methylase [Chloroflexota bacterium]
MQLIQIESRSAKPFLKWVGGKQQLLDQFALLFPAHFHSYHEPFLGGGAVYFHLWSSNQITGAAYLSDLNEELVDTYLAVRNRVDDVIAILRKHEANHSHDYYYHVRAADRKMHQLTQVEKAARLIYLNRTCYNGLYRVNRKGQFNVPIGSYQAPKIVFEDTLRAASRALQPANLHIRKFESVLDYAQAGDFIYFDPPYVPISKTASFTSYTLDSFSDENQHQLAEVFGELSRRGCYCMLSNSYSPLTLNLYRDYRIETVRAIRAVNSNGGARGAINEVVVLNY